MRIPSTVRAQDVERSRLFRGSLMTTTIVTPAQGAWTSGTAARGKAAMTSHKRHIISILMQNEVGALTRVTSLFSTRGYNIESLNVAPTDEPTVSRLTLVTSGTDSVIQQIVNQSLKLVDVVNVDDMTRDSHVERELLLIKLRVPGERFEALQELVKSAGARILGDDLQSYTLELTDSESRVSCFIAEAAGIAEVLEVVRSGALALLRGAQTLQT